MLGNSPYGYEEMYHDLQQLVGRYKATLRPLIPVISYVTLCETVRQYGNNGMIEALRFMRNTEAAVNPFYVPMLKGRSPGPIEEFTEIWNQEETYHAQRLAEIELWLSDILSIQSQTTDEFIQQARPYYVKEYAITIAAHWMLGAKFMFLHKFVGLIQEITATTGYHLMAQKLPPLSNFFKGFAKQERLHISFYADALEIIMKLLVQSASGQWLIRYAPWCASKFLNPVGSGLQPKLAKSAMAYIFSDEDAPNMLAANLKRLDIIYPAPWASIILGRVHGVIA